ncbi:MAG: hypothetical protein M3512_07620 [Bacteroidota bacterium]|nr:hypothetical protein [Bacteroidota bacterium]
MAFFFKRKEEANGGWPLAVRFYGLANSGSAVSELPVSYLLSLITLKVSVSSLRCSFTR